MFPGEKCSFLVFLFSFGVVAPGYLCLICGFAMVYDGVQIGVSTTFFRSRFLEVFLLIKPPKIVQLDYEARKEALFGETITYICYMLVSV